MIHQQKFRKISQSASDQSGFTIIESLVAILLVTFLLAAIAPAIIISTATRLQAKRIESAANAAKRYIDGVRSGEIAAPSNISTTTTTSFSSQFVAPTGGSLNCDSSSSNPKYPYCITPSTSTYNLYCADVDGTGCNKTSIKNYVIEAFAYNQATSVSAKGYQLGIRVYRPDAFANTTALETSIKPPTYAGGLGDPKAPLIEMTTEITHGVAFTDFCKRLNSGAANTNTTCS